MTPEDILSHKPIVLSQKQREFYFTNGYLLVEKIIGSDWLDRLNAAVARKVDESRRITKPDRVFDLETGHSAEDPRLRRVSSPNDHDPVFWDFASKSVLADVVADLVGPNVRFYQSKLNFKWSRGGAEVKMHQDCPFFPHTNTAVLTVGTYLFDCDSEQGPLGVLPGSHEGPLYDHYDQNGNWRGALSDEDAASLPLDKVDYLCGPAGSITLHNYRAVHGSKPNLSARGRPLLLNVMSAADALPYTPNALPSKYDGTIIRGEKARWAHHDPRPCIVPPDWSRGYTSIFAIQQGEGEQSTGKAAA